MEGHKVAQISPMQENRNKEGCNFFGNSIPQIEIIVNFETKSWLEHIANVQSMP